jgi:hypothetical protein
MNKHLRRALIAIVVVLLVVAYSVYIVNTVPNPEPFGDVWAGVTDGEINGDRALRLFEIFKEITERHDQHYFMMCGTLLGVGRHGGFIPWDDDIDVGISEKWFADIISPEIEQEFAEYGVGITKHFNGMHKLFFKDQKRIGKYPFTWPFIDLFAYRISVDKIHMNIPEAVTFDKQIILPVAQDEFEGMQVSVPHDMIAVLNQLFGKSWKEMCYSSSYNHRVHKMIRLGDVKKVRCDSLPDEA